jgi:hypothetical protein
LPSLRGRNASRHWGVDEGHARSRGDGLQSIGRDEIPAESDVDVIMDLRYGAAYHRLLQGHLAITPDFIEHVARVVAEGAKAGAAITST